MKLREFQAKSVFARYGLQVPPGRLARTPSEAYDISRALGGAVVLKPQLGVKGRGKAGAIAMATTAEQAREQAQRLLQMQVKGETVTTLLVESRAEIVQELYLAVTVDYARRLPVLIASAQGGVEIESVDSTAIHKIPVDILQGPQEDDWQPVQQDLGPEVVTVLQTLYRIFRDYDAELVEINPLARTRNQGLVAVDAVLNINPDALVRQQDKIREFQADIPTDALVTEAAQRHWTYIDLPGNIGVLSSGAGLTMAILDLLHHLGGKPANFLDTAQMDTQGIYDAFDFMLRAKPVRVLLVNIFAGLNRCDQLAAGIEQYLQDHPLPIPLVVRMVGNQEKAGHAILRDIGIEPFTVLEEAIARSIELAREEVS